MHYLVTGGCGFIGSHLSEALLKAGHQVTLLDDLSTGKIANVQHLEANKSFQLFIGSVTDRELVHEAVRNSDAVFHLASAVGVKLIMDRPVETIDTIVTGTQYVLEQANRYRKPVLLTSTSEVYGKSTSVPFEEDGDRLAGSTTKHRWAYACAKALDEFLAMAYWRSSRLPVVITRLFNTVGPRQTGQYGMVIPTFASKALRGEPLTIYGDGTQSRCFCHVHDVVAGLIALMDCQEARGEVVNLGSTEEISITDLAQLIVTEAQSESNLEYVSYESVFGDGFEDMIRRVPSIKKAQSLINWTPQHSLKDTVRSVIAHQQTQ